MKQPEDVGELARIQQAIEAQEKLRGIVDDAVLDETIRTLKEKLAALEPISQHRKQLTILFMDVAGSTEIVRDLDPEENLAIMDNALRRLSEPVKVHGGQVTRYMGDGFKAIFGHPTAHENDPEMAVRAGLAILETAAQYAIELEAEKGIPGFKVRLGIHTGLVVAGGISEGARTVMGATVNLAARLESSALPGTLLISHQTYQHVRGVFDFVPKTAIKAKGFDEPVQVYQVLRAKPRAFRMGRRGVEGVETRMIGREAELKRFQDAFYTMLEDHQLQMVTVTGEAGLGKSRLLYEFENWLDLQPENVRLFKARSRLESQSLPFALLRDMFSFRFQIDDSDSADVVQGKLERGFKEFLVRDERRVTHRIGRLLGFDLNTGENGSDSFEEPRESRARALNDMVEYFRTASEDTVAAIFIEDLHWADEASLDAINHLTIHLRSFPVLFIGLARPSFMDRRPHWGEGQLFHTKLKLSTLSKRDSRNLVDEILKKVERIPSSLRELIIDNAEGNPFYIEELVKMLVDDRVIVKEDSHWEVHLERLAEVHVPSTLTGVLQARLARLPESEHALIQQASVIGRVFWDQVLMHLNRADIQVYEEKVIREGLTNLRMREMIFQRETSTFEDAREHYFKHAVLHQVTYESVLLRVRRKYHALIAEWLKQFRHDRLKEISGLIADHLEKAEAHSDAFEYLLIAGEEAAARYANEEAVNFYNRALVFLDRADLESRWNILSKREKLHQKMGKTHQQIEDIDQLETIASALPDGNYKAEVLIRRANYYYEIAEYQHACLGAEKAVAAAERSGNVYQQATANNRWATALWRGGDFEKSEEKANKALALSREGQDQKNEWRALNNLAALANLQGDLASGKAYYENILTLAREARDTDWIFNSIFNLIITKRELGISSNRLQLLQEALSLSRKMGQPKREAAVLQLIGEFECDRGDYENAERYYIQSLQIHEETEHHEFESLCHLYLGILYYRMDRFVEARQAYEKCKQIWDELQIPHRSILADAGLAQVDLSDGQQEKAMIRVETILDYLSKHGQIDFVSYRSRIYGICIRVLQAEGDERAGPILKSAHQLLVDSARRIKDPDLSRSYLENVDWNREILDLYNAMELDL